MSGATTRSMLKAAWSANLDFEDGNASHRPRVKGGYFPVPPVDSLHDVRAAMCAAMEQMGLDVEVHHQVGTAERCEIGVDLTHSLPKQTVQILKYCVLNVPRLQEDRELPNHGGRQRFRYALQSLSKDGKYLCRRRLGFRILPFITWRHYQARATQRVYQCLNQQLQTLSARLTPVMLAYSAETDRRLFESPRTAPKG